MRPREEPLLHQRERPQEEERGAPPLKPWVVPTGLLALGLLLGGGLGYSLKPAEVIEKPGPERIVERPGPERVVTIPAKQVDCPTVQTIIQRIVTVEDRPKPVVVPKPKPKPVPQVVAPYRWAQSPPERRCDPMGLLC